MEFKEVIRNRYSCKKYSDKPIEAEKLTAVLEAGRLAPTAKNLQEQHIYVVQSAEGLAMCDLIAVTLEFGTQLTRHLIALATTSLRGTEGIRREGLLFSFQKNIDKAILVLFHDTTSLSLF